VKPEKSSFLSENEWGEWRMGSFPLMGEGIELAVAGAMASVIFVSVFSRTSKRQEWDFASLSCFFSIESNRLSKLLTFSFVSESSRVRAAMDDFS
jgi:hypothetical protein